MKVYLVNCKECRDIIAAADTESFTLAREQAESYAQQHIYFTEHTCSIVEEGSEPDHEIVDGVSYWTVEGRNRLLCD